MTENEMRILAKRRADFKRHLFVFVAVNVFLAIVNGLTFSGVYWEVWTALSWGLGLVLHGWAVYGGSQGTLEEREYQKLKKSVV